ncbi:hypoxia-inducible factor 1-alpha inhibitor [Exaiptasia diaphana]|uniref:JmjC domain-containing protein n=1 Tax=Exaiptasia diaphana TaxID=2652724 RepID=A0A913X2D2_EXADI|nr:hypoxia-inducible factor 1-alpha inhibitor [Exaiptasia diaphana]XP_028514210.1 hypoxia-inducible factor 1-alpha inhibitor [Exaiptasia diaphana]KXJ20689.1 Hypoxia-inducible factor 1-alpha inhibitor [Exaiptasia diaphana]
MLLFPLILLLQTSSTALRTNKICIQERGYTLNTSTAKRDDFYQACTRKCKTCSKPFPPDPRFKGRYSFPVKSIGRKNCDDPEAIAMIEKGIPLILKNCSFARSAHKWTVDYLNENLKDKDHITYVASQRRFLFYDEDKLIDNYKNWTPPHEKRLMYFHEFLKMARALKKANNGTLSYFQSPLYNIEGVSPALEKDINAFDYSWLLDIVSRLGWGDEVINLLFIGMSDVVTPAHYDILENFFVQIAGYKRVILFRPDYFKSLYPFPVGHPHDRQSQVNFDNPNFEKFPNFLDIEGLEAVVGPGDVLYIPIYWWHYVESERNNMTVSVNFWFNHKNDTMESTLNGTNSATHFTNHLKNVTPHSAKRTSVAGIEDLVLKREIESLIYETTKDHSKVVQVLKEIIAGRFGFVEKGTSASNP